MRGSARWPKTGAGPAQAGPALFSWRCAGAFAAVVCLAAWGAFALLLVELARHPFPWQFWRAWAPSLGLEFSLRVDGLSALMLLLITGVGARVFTYAAGYLAHDAAPLSPHGTAPGPCGS